MSTEIKFETTDTRSITIPQTLSNADTETLGKTILAYGQDGYALSAIGAIQRDEGSQRDPYIVTHGLKLTFKRS